MDQFVIKIKEAPLKENAKEMTNTILMAFDKNDNMLPYMKRAERALPGISSIVNKQMSYEEIYSIVENKVSEQLSNDNNRIKKKIKYFNSCIPQCSKAVTEMINVFNVQYKSTQTFVCFLGVYNPFPRSVLKKEFYLHYDVTYEVFLRASLHEINHMIMFDKWKSMHGYSSQKEPEFPDILWFLEELAVSPTLNDDRIQKIVPIKHKPYDSLERIEINGFSLPSHIQKIYDTSESIDAFLNNAYNFLYNTNIDKVYI